MSNMKAMTRDGPCHYSSPFNTMSWGRIVSQWHIRLLNYYRKWFVSMCLSVVVIVGVVVVYSRGCVFSLFSKLAGYCPFHARHNHSTDTFHPYLTDKIQYSNRWNKQLAIPYNTYSSTPFESIMTLIIEFFFARCGFVQTKFFFSDGYFYYLDDTFFGSGKFYIIGGAFWHSLIIYILVSYACTLIFIEPWSVLICWIRTSICLCTFCNFHIFDIFYLYLITTHFVLIMG